MDATLGSDQSLEYTIAGSSGHSGEYVAENILIDAPNDSGSRWSGNFPHPLEEQYLLLKMEKPSVLKSIKFGKHHKAHPCSTKDFRVLAGLTQDIMTEVVSGSIKNDPTPEVFGARYTNSQGVPFASQFVKIIPLSAHGTSYHTSIWHVGLIGVSDEAAVRPVTVAQKESVEATAIRLMLKFLRDRGMTSSYNALLAESGINFEGVLVKDMYQAISSGDFAFAERILSEAADAGLFATYMQSCRPTAVWTRMHGADPDGNIPAARGGHAMCIDDTRGILYLHGGFNGKESLDDFWMYTIAEDRWRLLNAHTADADGPGPRSCHRMVVDDATGNVYLLGRLSDEDAAECARIASDGDDVPARDPVAEVSAGSSGPELWCYHPHENGGGSWEQAPNADPGKAPLALFNHGMIMMPHLRTIFVYGGRGIDKDTIKDSGWYTYSIQENKWESGPEAVASSSSLGVRFSHMMVYEPNLRLIFIVGGQHKDRHLKDLWTYHVDTRVAVEVCANVEQCGRVDTTSHRMVINPTLNEIYLSSGIGAEQTSSSANDAYWAYRYEPATPHEHGKWLKISSPTNPTDSQIEKPVPRSAHQTVYHSASETIFVHGGNSGAPRGVGADGERPNPRLDDLWGMKLERMTADTVVRKMKFLVRAQQFREICKTSPVDGLRFLQTEVFAVVDHSNPAEVSAFQQDLLADVLSHESDEEEEGAKGGAGEPTSVFEERTRLFKYLMHFFSKSHKEPASDLFSLVAKSL